MTNYNVKYEIDYSNLEVNEKLFESKKQGILSRHWDVFELPKGSKAPKLNQIIKVKMANCVLYAEIYLIFKMSSGKYKVQANFIDVIKE